MPRITKRDVGVAVCAIMCACLLGIAMGTSYLWSGLYNVAASTPHADLTHWVLETARTRSIRAHARGIVAPTEAASEAQILAGLSHFAEHCAVCHGAPGVPQGDIARGLYPPAPDLAGTVRRYNAAETFWIVKFGIKSTGMPAWSDHADDALWATVAFIRMLPGLSKEDYAKLLMTSIMQGGHRH